MTSRKDLSDENKVNFSFLSIKILNLTNESFILSFIKRFGPNPIGVTLLDQELEKALKLFKKLTVASHKSNGSYVFNYFNARISALLLMSWVRLNFSSAR